MKNCLDAEGHLYVIDRMREAIQIGARLVFPAQIESVLYGHSEIADVAAVGEVDGIALFVVPRAPRTFDVASLWPHLRARLPEDCVPTRLLVVDHIPRNAANKILRGSLRARLAGRLPESGYQPPGEQSAESVE